ncbi:MAG TPA: class I SAM-dependent methyltransferase, partial [Gaiellaceae bacterium]|nr:class I SAM-dependent methyltransferase [Gaiellaceae bacterium]
METVQVRHPSRVAFVCPSCGAPELERFHEQQGVPVHSCRLVSTREEALSFPKGDLSLAFCRACGFIANTEFDGSVQDYGVAYEETQGFSPRFREFATDLARRWIDRYDLRGKEIVEIGSGKGEFLAAMCELGGNRGIGIDPAFVEERLDSSAADRIRFVKELYDGSFPLEADAVVCRHTIEHIAPVGAFLADIRRGIGDRRDTVVLFDLPDVVRVLREAAFWDVYYEHCSYLSPGSLARLFRRSGFEIVELERDYDDQYIVIEARPVDGVGSVVHPLEESVESLADDVAHFGEVLAATTSRWRQELGALRADGRRAVVWGAGSKAVAFLTTLGIEEEIHVAVDINPFKQDMFVAGTGHEVVAPERLVDIR